MKNPYDNRRLIVVSNREPYNIKDGNAVKTVGGLVSALDPIMRQRRGVWVASGSEARRVRVPVSPPNYTMRLIELSPGDIDGYYHGYSNRFLWPLCHLTLDRVYLRKSFWKSYLKVNELFARAVVEEVTRRSDVVWLQDYHLAVCARYIRELSPRAKVSIFWHIPWPPYDVFRACPQRRELLQGMLANDLIGFQIGSYKRNFMRCVDIELGASVDEDEGFINYRGHLTRVKAFPISIDYDWFDRAARTEGAGKFIRRFRRKRGLDGRLMGLSVDRLDYTKGIIKSLDAVEFFFAKYPRFRQKLTFVHVAVPTRKTEPYLSYIELVKKKLKRVNEKFSVDGWRPVEFIDTRVSHEDLAALYRDADVALISSVYDGMNLVAKEFVASQVDAKGTLLISEFAGASEEIPGAVVINPYDTEGCADALKKAIEAPPAVRRKAMGHARRYIKENNIYRWVDSILDEMDRIV